MKKIFLLVILFVIGCSVKLSTYIGNNYSPKPLENIKVEDLLNKKWVIQNYIIDDKTLAIEEERKNDYYIFESNNKKEEVFYGSQINGSWEFLPHGNFIMFYSADMNTYVPARIIELEENILKFDIFDIKLMKYITVSYKRDLSIRIPSKKNNSDLNYVEQNSNSYTFMDGYNSTIEMNLIYMKSSKELLMSIDYKSDYAFRIKKIIFITDSGSITLECPNLILKEYLNNRMQAIDAIKIKKETLVKLIQSKGLSVRLYGYRQSRSSLGSSNFRENIIWENRETSKDIISVESLQENWKMFYDTEIKNLINKK